MEIILTSGYFKMVYGRNVKEGLFMCVACVSHSLFHAWKVGDAVMWLEWEGGVRCQRLHRVYILPSALSLSGSTFP